MSGPRIALVTQRALPDWERDDLPLADVLRDRGAEVAQPVWDDPAVDWSGFDLALVRTAWDYAPRRDAFVAWAERAARATRLHNPPAVLRWNTDKAYLLELARAGAPLLPTLWLERGSAPDLVALLADRPWPRAFLKPAFGNAADGTLRFTTDRPGLALATAHVADLLPRTAMLLQPYEESVEREGELSMIFIEGAISHAVRKLPVAGDYRVQDDHGATDAPYAPSQVELATARRLLALAGERLGLEAPLLYARVDFLRGPGGALCLNELELVEPSLFFRHAPAAAPRFADAILARARAPRPSGALRARAG
ncbi:MAG: hypothetical protein H6744_01770 [Deltaproteobacteria bacterium]|nr:hypothetical protein [Deltaproteobacteria bacterium]MCB9785396.1 hypothetical protein [Deltaproteobacteria bacterium]